MSTKKKLLEAAAGAAGGDPVYVDDVFSTYVYEGNGSTQNIVNGIDLSGEGGLVWSKCRSNADRHVFIDTERGRLKYLRSDSGAAEATLSDTYGINSFNSNGYTLGANADWININTRTNCSWTFRKQPGFFDVVTWTGNGVSGREIPHSLGSVPGMILVKNLNLASDWRVFHRSLGPTKNMLLNGTNAALTQTGMWNDTAPTSTVFTVGNDGGVNGNASTYNYVAYVFAHDAQDFGEDSDEAIIKCGSYTGNGSTTGPVIDLGFEPQWLLIKCSSHDGQFWMLFDSMRGIVTNGTDQYLLANDSGAEGSYQFVNLTSTGFQPNTTGTYVNANGYTYTYMAIRRPHKPASEFAATDLFAIDELSVSTTPNFESGFPVDFAINRQPVGGTSNWNVGARLIQGRRLFTNLTDAESAESSNQFDYQDGYGGANLTNYLGYMWRRAPGFFDVVTFDGGGAGAVVNHNLGVKPDLLIYKRRSASNDWIVYNSIDGANYAMFLNLADARESQVQWWNNTEPTAANFTTGSKAFSGSTYIAYLFASVAGISKVGSYTATGSNINVDCGFSSGARFVLIKWASDVGPWYLWDSERGIVAGADPYLQLNSAYAQVTTSDWIDPLSSGFTVTSAAGNDVNNSGGEYIFYAIA